VGGARWFLTADGQSEVLCGNLTIRVTPGGQVSVRLPRPLEHLANAPNGRLVLSAPAGFGDRGGDWLDRVTANKAVRYDITYDPGKDRWYLDASWKTNPIPAPSLDDLAGLRRLAVDTNADHLACWVIDPSGNPVGPPCTIALELAGLSACTRDGGCAPPSAT
jgi:hypothetical protein